MENNYFLIEVDGQENIGVLNLGSMPITEENMPVIEEILKPKLTEAIQSHFDSEVIAITHIEMDKYSYSNTINITLALEQDNEDREENEPLIITEVTLSRTWVY